MSIDSARDAVHRATPSSRLLACAASPTADVPALLESTATGLSVAEAARRLVATGPNEVVAQATPSVLRRLVRLLINPLVVLLAVLATVSVATGDLRSAVVITVMIVIGVVLRFVQESRADRAATALRAMIRITAAVTRDGTTEERPLREIVPGDLIVLNAGDMIPADLRLLQAKDVFINQATLTGESMPAQKHADPIDPTGLAALDCANLCLLGTSVQSGTAVGLVVETGPRTLFGQIAVALGAEEAPTAFDRGITRFTWLMIRFIGVMVPLVFLINGLTKHDWREAFFFALAVAVGLTPEMLPAIVSVSLARGAVAMSRRRTIVKRLDAIQNVGGMDVLCTDKTGTLTQDVVILERHCDVDGRESDAVLLAATLVSHFQTGLQSVLDRAILAHLAGKPQLPLDPFTKVDEIPFDFSRRLMSVVVSGPDGGHRLIAKGAAEEVLGRCTQVTTLGGDASSETVPLDAPRRTNANARYAALSEDGFRVLAVAVRDFAAGATRPSYTVADEAELTLVGFVAFLDPPKESARPALAASGIAVKVLTGDNELVTRTICRQLDIPVEQILLGADVERMDDAALTVAAGQVSVFARLLPAHKQRVIAALQRGGHVVGYLGDGINDAPALRAADVGISVDTAVDVAKESADIILLEKSLLVLQEGVLEGRRVFANVVKYIRMGASSNFGNMFSVIGASALLPFVPMAPIQVLTNNLLYDLAQLPIPTDRVDDEQIARPRPWDLREIGRFILLLGPISSIFDYATFAAMWFLFSANTPAEAALFRTGWFVESLMTQTLIIHVIRTNRIPFVQSRASTPLLLMTLAIVAFGAWLPASPLASSLGFVPLPARYWPVLAAILVGYLTLTQLAKRLFLRKGWI